VFAQDKWTISRLTPNYGLRLDTFPNWKDVSPRIGGAYDLFGNGKTALKVSLAKYLGLTGGTGIVSANNPINTSVNSVTRDWTDGNLNYFPDCNFANPAQNGECGPFSDANFGKDNPKANIFDLALLNGWGVRPTIWEGGAEVQHQLTPGVTVNAGYFHN
jgi:hypothetical protein